MNHAGAMDLVAPEQRPDTRDQHVEVERLGQVVVRAGVEAPNLVRGGIPGRQHQDRHEAAAGAERRADAPAIHPRQHQIQDKERVLTFQGALQPGGAVAGDVHGEARLLQPHPDQVRHHLVVFDKQNPHDDPRASASVAPPRDGGDDLYFHTFSAAAHEDFKNGRLSLAACQARSSPVDVQGLMPWVDSAPSYPAGVKKWIRRVGRQVLGLGW
jgi:hypothetical protein